jgi:hypothetical protein
MNAQPAVGARRGFVTYAGVHSATATEALYSRGCFFPDRIHINLFFCVF